MGSCPNVLSRLECPACGSSSYHDQWEAHLEHSLVEISTARFKSLPALEIRGQGRLVTSEWSNKHLRLASHVLALIIQFWRFFLNGIAE